MPKKVDCNMRHILFLIILSLFSTIANGQTYTISATTNIPDGSKLYLLKNFPAGKPEIDSAVVTNHQFSFKKTDDLHPYLYFLTKTSNIRPPWLRFIWDGPITIFLDSTIGVEHSVVKNSPLTTEYNRHFAEDIQMLSDSFTSVIIRYQSIDRQTDSVAFAENIRQQQNIIKAEAAVEKRYVKAHPSSFVALESLWWIWGQMDYAGMQEYYNAIDWKQVNHPYKQIFDSLLNEEKKVTAGNRIDFHLQTTANKIITLDSLNGSNVLIDFWGSWCGPCIRSIPELNKIYAKYHQLKHLDILSIAVEREDEGKQRARALITKNNMNWQHVVQTEPALSGILNDYNVQAFPTYVLLDKQGKIRLFLYGLTEDNIKKLEATIEQL